MAVEDVPYCVNLLRVALAYFRPRHVNNNIYICSTKFKYENLKHFLIFLTKMIYLKTGYHHVSNDDSTILGYSWEFDNQQIFIFVVLSFGLSQLIYFTIYFYQAHFPTCN